MTPTEMKNEIIRLLELADERQLRIILQVVAPIEHK